MFTVSETDTCTSWFATTTGKPARKFPSGPFTTRMYVPGDSGSVGNVAVSDPVSRTASTIFFFRLYRYNVYSVLESGAVTLAVNSFPIETVANAEMTKSVPLNVYVRSGIVMLSAIEI